MESDLNRKFYRFIQKFSKSILSIVMVVGIYLVYHFSSDLKIVFIVSICFATIFLIVLLHEKAIKNEVENVFSNISDLIETLINNNGEEIFSLTEDTITSKVQFQIKKLNRILTNRCNAVNFEKNEIKSLVSDISHQLKTPITNLKMYIEILSDNTLSCEERDEFNTCVSDILDSLVFLTESLIKMSRLESGVIKLDKQECIINDVVLSGISSITTMCENKNIGLEYEEIDSVLCEVDFKWMQEAIVNILENAVKYSFENTVIKVKVEKYEIFSKIDIINKGVTIDESEYSKIFKRFYRGTNAVEKDGIGIGLYLSNKIINLHEGYIRVRCNENIVIFSVFLRNM